jgi:cystathionine beta-lyase
MKYDFDQIHHRARTDSIKWDHMYVDGQLQRRLAGEDPLAKDELLPMWLADMDFPTAEPVIEALIRRVRHGIFGYTLTGESFHRSIVNWVSRRHGWQVESKWIVTAPGVMQSINLIIQTFTNLGDQIIVQSPFFRPIADSVQNNGRILSINPLKYEDGRYAMDFDDLALKAAGGRTRMIILCNPHNPVGRAWSLEELSELGRLCQRHNLLIVSDEIHGDLTYSWAGFTSVGALGEAFHDRLLICCGASKAFNLPGLRSSLVLIPNDGLRQRFSTTLRNLNETFGVNALGTLATQAAYESGEEWLDQLMAYVEANLLHLVSYVDEHLPQLQLVRPDALYLVWIDCRGLGLDRVVLRQFFVNCAKVLPEWGDGFGAEGAGFVRLNIACPRIVLRAALERIRSAVDRLAESDAEECAGDKKR